jgi:hypothetical protein
MQGAVFRFILVRIPGCICVPAAQQSLQQGVAAYPITRSVNLQCVSLNHCRHGHCVQHTVAVRSNKYIARNTIKLTTVFIDTSYKYTAI